MYTQKIMPKLGSHVVSRAGRNSKSAQKASFVTLRDLTKSMERAEFHTEKLAPAKPNAKSKLSVDWRYASPDYCLI